MDIDNVLIEFKRLAEHLTQKHEKLRAGYWYDEEYKTAFFWHNSPSLAKRDDEFKAALNNLAKSLAKQEFYSFSFVTGYNDYEVFEKDPYEESVESEINHIVPNAWSSHWNKYEVLTISQRYNASTRFSELTRLVLEPSGKFPDVSLKMHGGVVIPRSGYSAQIEANIQFEDAIAIGAICDDGKKCRRDYS